MCGIAGIYNLEKNRPINKNLLEKFKEDMNLRGPDEAGIILEENFGFVHTRLSILDPENGKQPYTYNNSSITFNGEIYNFKDLNSKLISDGIDIKTNCDTETLIKYITKYGIYSIRNIDGMFAFAISDNNRLILARDHAGKKPLFYAVKNGQLFFSSSMKSLLSVAGNELDTTVFLYSMMYGNLTFGDRTIYKNIRTVESGHFMMFTDSETPLNSQYWKLEAGKKYYDLSFDDSKERLRDILDRAVKKRLISDVPLGMFLSGGLDSTIIVSLAKKYKEDLRTFSICYNDEEVKENYFADMASKFLKTNHTAITPDFSSYQYDMKKLISAKGAPLSTPNEVLIEKLSREASKELKVVLSGEGADELFNGYSAISRAAFDFIRYMNFDSLLEKSKFQQSLLRAYSYSEFMSPVYHFQTFFRRFTNSDLLQAFDLDKINITDAITEIDDFFAVKFNEYRDLSLYGTYSSVVFELNLKSLLERLDFNTMQGSLEARAPFLDKELIDFAFNIPLKYKLKISDIRKCYCEYNSPEFSNNFDTTKYILREAFKNEIPEEIITRKKQSFPVPYYDLVNDKNKEFINEIFKRYSNLTNLNTFSNWFNIFCTKESSFKYWSMLNYAHFFSLKKK